MKVHKKKCRETSNTQNQQQMDFENLNCIKFNLTDTACIPRVISSLSRLKTALPDYSPKLQMTQVEPFSSETCCSAASSGKAVLIFAQCTTYCKYQLTQKIWQLYHSIKIHDTCNTKCSGTQLSIFITDTLCSNGIRQKSLHISHCHKTQKY